VTPSNEEPGLRLPYGAAIRGVGAFVPPKVMTNRDLERLVDTTDEWIVSRTGIRERRILEEGKATSDMAIPAAWQALDRAGISPETIGLVIVATITGDYVFPSTACIVQNRMGMKNAAAFDLGAACSGFIYALSTASQFVMTGAYEHVLVIGADTNSRLVDWTDRGTCVIFGDGASAVLLSRSEPGTGILSSFLRADGSGLKHLHQPGGGSLHPPTIDTVSAGLHHIKMEGQETFKFAARAMAEACDQAIRGARISFEDVSLMIPHQANIRIIHAAAKRMGIPEDKLVVNIDRYGNTVAASIGLALNEALEGGRISTNDHLLLVGFGAGLTWGGMIIKWSL